MDPEMELVNRYVHEVGRRLPKKMRGDVEAELRSTLLDAVEDRLSGAPEPGSAGQNAREQAVVDVLQEFGPPDKMAAQYAPPYRYLIGPRLFTMYLVVIGAVAGAITLSFLIGFALSLRETASFWADLGRALLQSGAGYWSALMSGLGSVTLVFAILERVLPISDPFQSDEEAWNPRSLPSVEDRSRIQPASLIVGIAFFLIVLALFNLFPSKVGLWMFYTPEGGGGAMEWQIFPVLADTFFTAHLPLLNVSWVLTIMLNLILLCQGRWQLGTRLFEIGLEVLSIVILVRFLTGPAVLDVNQFMLALQGAGLDDAALAAQRTLIPLLGRLMQGVLTLAIVLTAVEIVQKLVRIVRVEPAVVLNAPDR